MPARRPSASDPAAQDPGALVVDTIREHAAGLLAIARRYSLCPDDAQDAYQRAVEIFIRRAHRLQREGAASWLRTVVKHEALAVRAGRQRLLAGAELDLDEQAACPSRGPEERAADADQLTRSAEALQRLKPQEVRALLLKAQGHSYREICELTGWSYTNINCSIGPSCRGTSETGAGAWPRGKSGSQRRLPAAPETKAGGDEAVALLSSTTGVSAVRLKTTFVLSERLRRRARGSCSSSAAGTSSAMLETTPSRRRRSRTARACRASCSSAAGGLPTLGARS